jgi:hypothetical protein
LDQIDELIVNKNVGSFKELIKLTNDTINEPINDANEPINEPINGTIIKKRRPTG